MDNNQSALMQMLMQRQQQPQMQEMDMKSRLLEWLRQRQQMQYDRATPTIQQPSGFPSDQMNYSPYAPWSGQG